MEGFPPPADKRVTIDNYGSSKEMMRWAMLHPAVVFRTREVDCGSTPVRLLPRHMVDPERVDGAKVNWGKGGVVTVAEWLRGSGTDAFLALHDGHIVAEQYFGEMTPQTQHRVFSIAKSFTAAAGADMLANQTVDEREFAARYVPELEQTAYQGATVRHLLDMQVSIRYEYFCPADEKAKGHEKAWEMGTPEFRRAQHAQARYQRICGMMRKLEGEENLGAYDVLFEIGQGVTRRRQRRSAPRKPSS